MSPPSGNRVVNLYLGAAIGAIVYAQGCDNTVLAYVENPRVHKELNLIMFDVPLHFKADSFASKFFKDIVIKTDKDNLLRVLLENFKDKFENNLVLPNTKLVRSLLETISNLEIVEENDDVLVVVRTGLR